METQQTPTPETPQEVTKKSDEWFRLAKSTKDLDKKIHYFS